MSERENKKITIFLSPKEYDDVRDLLILWPKTDSFCARKGFVGRSIPIVLVDLVRKNRKNITALRWCRHQHTKNAEGIDFCEGYTYPSIRKAIEYMREQEAKHE